MPIDQLNIPPIPNHKKSLYWKINFYEITMSKMQHIDKIKPLYDFIHFRNSRRSIIWFISSVHFQSFFAFLKVVGNKNPNP